ncbi:MAG: helix-turn-helix domain-containing protein [Geodermatophilaceae bacterium]|nr:helix-turn-helix domain-containing protein [Geodermatophilaceae bacterium]
MLTVPEAARKVGRNAETVRRWIRTGRLPAQRAGTQHLIDEKLLDDLVGSDRSPLPRSWATFDDGSAQPDWESIVRDQRRGH